MRKQVLAVAVAAALSLAGGAAAQQMEAVVTVTKVDQAARIVQVRTPQGQTTVHLPPDIDMGEIKEGSRYRVRYSEPVATAVEHGAQAAGAGATAEAKAGGQPGEGTKIAQASGLLEAKDAANQRITVRTRDGQKQMFRLGEGVSAESITAGDGVTVTYQQAVASRMVSTPQPERDPYAPQ